MGRLGGGSGVLRLLQELTLRCTRNLRRVTAALWGMDQASHVAAIEIDILIAETIGRALSASQATTPAPLPATAASTALPAFRAPR